MIGRFYSGRTSALFRFHFLNAACAEREESILEVILCTKIIEFSKDGAGFRERSIHLGLNKQDNFFLFIDLFQMFILVFDSSLTRGIVGVEIRDM